MPIKKNKKISLNSSDFQNKRRLIRAIEINKNYKLKIKIFSLSPIPYSFLKIGIDMPRQKVYERIDRRTKSWMKNDLLINEVKNLIRQKISKKRIIEFGLGYRETLRYLAGEIKTKEELADRINFSQHAYVRRQLTWFRKDKEIKWCKKLAEAEKLVNHFLLK
jgi:tRNA dimethylallyltransferase